MGYPPGVALFPSTFSDDERWAMWHDGVRCAGVRQDGQRCNNVARKDTMLCYWHTPGAAQERTERIRKALARATEPE